MSGSANRGLGAAALAAFADEIEKLAYGPKQAQRVLRLGKALVPGKATSRAMQNEVLQVISDATKAPLPKSLQHFGVGPLSASQGLVAATRKMVPRIEKSPLGSILKERMLQTPSPVAGAIQKRVPRGAIVSQKRGDVVQLLSRHGADASKLSPEHRKMVNSILMGHEMDELGKRHPGLAFRSVGHISPSVMLREHNRLATLPEGYEPVREFMQKVRSKAEGPALRRFGVTYGKPGTRLNRHAIRDLSNRMNEAAVQEINSTALPPHLARRA